MTRTEAADLIETIIASLKDNPNQFTLSIKVVGQQITASGGGTGLQVTAVGGGPGSTTIGNQVSMAGAQIQITPQQHAHAAFDQQARALVETLQTIATQLRAPTPDQSVIQRAMGSLKNTWVPGVIIGVVGNVVSKALGV
jgi:hypothetical protein